MNGLLARALIVDPVSDWLAGFGISSCPEARVMLLAIAEQETAWQARRQMGGGPARSFWQFERAGVAGVLDHMATHALSRRVCAALGFPPIAATLHAAMEQNDALACAFARLLLRTDPASVPAGREPGWACYFRLWKPGKPDHGRWLHAWDAACAAMEFTP